MQTQQFTGDKLIPDKVGEKLQIHYTFRTGYSVGKNEVIYTVITLPFLLPSQIGKQFTGRKAAFTCTSLAEQRRLAMS